MLLLYGKVNPSILIGSFLVGISPYGPFPWKRSEAVYFLFSKAGKLKTSMVRVPYNKVLTNLASSSRTGEYWPSVVFVRTSLRSVRTATTLGQYSPVRPSRLVNKRLVVDLNITKGQGTGKIYSLRRGFVLWRLLSTYFIVTQASEIVHYTPHFIIEVR